jgi:hypothetical protein
LDKRQDILGQVSNFQGAQPEEAAHREEEQAAAPAAIHPFISVNRQFSLQTRSNRLAPGDSLTARSASSGASRKKKSQREE